VSCGNRTRGAAIPACADGGATGGTTADAAPAAIDALSARAAGENFPVALRALPRAYRRHLMAVYRFARFVDDIGDEVGPVLTGPVLTGQVPADADRISYRLRALDAVEADLDGVFSAGPRLPVVRELARTATACAIPAELFRMLIQANRQDQTVSRYANFEDLLGYCRLSANPVGRIVLHIFGAATPERERLSDLVCTALQLAEHWQDVAEDFGRGRVYLPQEDLAAFRCAEGDLAPAACPTGEARPAASASAATVRTAPPCLRELIRFETERTGRLLDEGAALTGTLHGWARLAVAGYVAGGRATLAAIAMAGAPGFARSDRNGNSVSSGRFARPFGPGGFDVLGATPRPSRARTAVSLIRAYLTGR
jgi:squalene synthase HpnC